MINPIIRTGIRLLELLFFAGIVGSVLVILLAGFEDVKTMLGGKDQEK